MLLTSNYKLLCRQINVFHAFDLNISIIMQTNNGVSCFWPQHINYYADICRLFILLTLTYQKYFGLSYFWPQNINSYAEICRFLLRLWPRPEEPRATQWATKGSPGRGLVCARYAHGMRAVCADGRSGLRAYRNINYYAEICGFFVLLTRTNLLLCRNIVVFHAFDLKI